MRLPITLIFSLFVLQLQAQKCTKCDTNAVKMAQKHLATLTQEMVSNFLCTMDSSCERNAEYSELSNKVLFQILDHKPALVLTYLTSNKNLNKLIILSEMEDPDDENLDVKTIIRKVRAAQGNPAIKSEVIKALEEAVDDDDE